MSSNESTAESGNGGDGRYQRLVDAIRDYAIFMLDSAGRIQSWNPGAEAIKGYTADEIVGRSFEVFYTAEDTAAGRPAEILSRAGRDGQCEDEGWRVRKDGSRFWASALVTAVRDASGRLTGFAKVTRDLTERRRMAATLALQGAVLNTVGEGVMVGRESDGIVVYANPAAEAVLRAQPGTLEGFHLSRAFPGGEWQLSDMPEHVQRSMREHGRATQEAPRLRVDGTRFWAHINVARFVDPEHGPLRVISFHDVTDRRHAEENLRQAHDNLDARVRERTLELTRANEMLLAEIARRAHAEKTAAILERRFNRLSESGLIGVFVSQRDGLIVQANDAFLRLIDYERDEIEAGRLTWRRLTPAGWLLESEKLTQALDERGFAGPWEKEYQRRDGTQIPVLIGVATLDESFSITFVVDISQRKVAEASLRRAEEQLRHSQKMEAIGRLAGGVAHDFNNLLSVILSYAALLNRELSLDDPKREDVDEIRKAAERAAGLTKQLLLFSRQQESAPRVLDLNEVLAGMDRMLQRVIGEDISLVTLRSPGIGRVHVDPGHVEQVIMNLVVNARDAMPTGGKLTIETARVELDATYAAEHAGVKPGPYVMMAITDTGCGMDAATRERIFEPFFTTKELGKGTGLGLSTVFGIVQRAEGSLWVYSEPGRGTTFKVYFPQVSAPVDSTARDARAAWRGTETVLLVEDEGMLRRVVGTILRQQGYTVVEAANAEEAIRACEQPGATIDLLLTDVVMPLVSGPELARRARDIRPHLKVLCMSGYADDSVIRHGLIDASFPFIQKPISPDRLAAKVREVLDAGV